jgi:hypothetical protein
LSFTFVSVTKFSPILNINSQWNISTIS